MTSALLAVSVAACTTPADPGPPSQADPACPHLQIKAPDLVPSGAQAHVSVSVIGAAGAPTFHWTVTDGSVVSGQGTPNVVIDTTGFTGKTIRAIVELGGLPPECATKIASAFVLIGPATKTTSR
jgi:hypothetical protein